MDIEIEKVIERLNEFKPDDGSFIELDEILEGLNNVSEPRLAYEAMYKVFERYSEDYDEPMWSIVHTLEHFKDYEEELIKSLRRKPTEFTVIMLNRILNTGQKTYKEYNLLEILEEVMLNQCSSKEVEELALKYYNKHK